VQIKTMITIITPCIIKKQILQGLNLSYRGDWYSLRAKFTNDSNFFVHEVGRGRGVLERSLEITALTDSGIFPLFKQ